MKKVLFLIIMMFSFLASVNSQEIVKNEIDDFTGNRVIETSWEKLAWGLGVPSGIYTRIRSINGTMVLDMKYMIDDAVVIGKGDKLMFLDTNKKPYEVHSIDTYMGVKGGGAIGLAGSAVWGIHAQYSGDLGFLNTSTIQKIRIYTTKGYYDKEIKKKYQNTLQELYKLVIKASIMR